jgi:dihydroxyacetone kinase
MIGDDVALARTASAGVGRRGIAGTVFVHKIAGASAAEGAALRLFGTISTRFRINWHDGRCAFPLHRAGSRKT